MTSSAFPVVPIKSLVFVGTLSWKKSLCVCVTYAKDLSSNFLRGSLKSPPALLPHPFKWGESIRLIWPNKLVCVCVCVFALYVNVVVVVEGMGVRCIRKELCGGKRVAEMNTHTHQCKPNTSLEKGSWPLLHSNSISEQHRHREDESLSATEQHGQEKWGENCHNEQYRKNTTYNCLISYCLASAGRENTLFLWRNKNHLIYFKV